MTGSEGYSLSRLQSVLALGVAATSRETGEEYVTVKEIANYLNRDSATVRTYLNQMEKPGITETQSERPLPLKTEKDAREKFWTLTYGIGPDGIEELLEDHPEIEEYVKDEDIEVLLSEETVSFEQLTESGEKTRDSPTKDRVDELMEDYPDVVEYFGGRDEVYDLFDLSKE